MKRSTHLEKSRVASAGYRQGHSMSLRGRRKSLTQGKRRETKWSEALPWVQSLNDPGARFSGRRVARFDPYLSPAKAGSVTYSDRDPGFRSLRSLHPGLNSAASFAGSLRSFFRLVSCWSILEEKEMSLS
jgi:hypothetical protein